MTAQPSVPEAAPLNFNDLSPEELRGLANNYRALALRDSETASGENPEQNPVVLYYRTLADYAESVEVPVFTGRQFDGDVFGFNIRTFEEVSNFVLTRGHGLVHGPDGDNVFGTLDSLAVRTQRGRDNDEQIDFSQDQPNAGVVIAASALLNRGGSNLSTENRQVLEQLNETYGEGAAVLTKIDLELWRLYQNKDGQGREVAEIAVNFRDVGTGEITTQVYTVQGETTERDPVQHHVIEALRDADGNITHGIDEVTVRSGSAISDFFVGTNISIEAQAPAQTPPSLTPFNGTSEYYDLVADIFAEIAANNPGVDLWGGIFGSGFRFESSLQERRIDIGGDLGVNFNTLEAASFVSSAGVLVNEALAYVESGRQDEYRQRFDDFLAQFLPITPQHLETSPGPAT